QRRLSNLQEEYKTLQSQNAQLVRQVKTLTERLEAAQNGPEEGELRAVQRQLQEREAETARLANRVADLEKGLATAASASMDMFQAKLGEKDARIAELEVALQQARGALATRRADED